MIVTVVLQEKNVKGKVDINPSLSISKLKQTLVKLLDLDNPDDYVLALSVNTARENEAKIGDLEIKEGDFIYLLSSETFSQPPVKIVEPFE